MSIVHASMRMDLISNSLIWSRRVCDCSMALKAKDD